MSEPVSPARRPLPNVVPAHHAMAWGVRASFRAYVEEAGEIRIEAPASAAGREFRFRRAACDGDVVRYEGAVLFTAHGGLLRLEVRDPSIHREGERLVLSVADTTAPGRRLILADLEPATDGSGLHATLAPEGAVAFDFRYPAGSPLEPVHLEPPSDHHETTRRT
ncbi:HtaA domain-containing protein [Sphaerisporangium viridialbum]|uniref:HtaA domain-containing protein n=1 Tax=Sphaerisporangium viridialbum TaxID=46189 RepID=UPI003C730F87